MPEETQLQVEKKIFTFGYIEGGEDTTNKACEKCKNENKLVKAKAVNTDDCNTTDEVTFENKRTETFAAVGHILKKIQGHRLGWCNFNKIN